LKVSELMTRTVVTAYENTPVAEIARLMLAHDVSGIPVISHDGRLVGIVTEGDLVVQNANVHFPTFLEILDVRIPLSSNHQFEEELRRALGTTAADTMTSEVLTVGPDDEISEAATLMADKRVNPVPVLDGERLVGIVSRSDIIRHILAEYENRTKA
jgi:CBS domain-containing protein